MSKNNVQTGLRITTILVAMVVGVVAITLCCFLALFLNRYQEAMVQNARTTSVQAVSQVSTTVSNYLSDMRQAMELVEQSMSETDESRDELLSAFLEFRPDVVAVTSYSHDGQLLQCWSPDHEPKDNILQNLSFDLEKAQASQGPYMSAPHVESIFEGYYPWVVTMTSRLPQDGSAAWVSLDLSFSSISSYMNNVSIGQRGYCFLMDGDGNMVYHPQQQLLYSGLKSEDTAKLSQMEDGAWANDTVIYSLTSVEGSDWRVVGVSYVDELVNRNVSEMVHLSLLIAAMVLLAALFTSWLLSRLLSRPLRSLESAMEDFESDADHFDYYPVGGTREVQELSCSFGHMVMRIQQLMNTVREEEVNLRKTELKALQAQINPHFLYNTLDTIKWSAKIHQLPEVAVMAENLAGILRQALSSREFVTLKEELETIDSYMAIQKARLPEGFQYEAEVPDSLMSALVPKMLLQPLVENAVLHGVEHDGNGYICIFAAQEGTDLKISVFDDGRGMPPEVVRWINSPSPEKRDGHLGLYNLISILKIHYGEGYGLKARSGDGEGTTITITLPMEEKHV